MRGSDRKGKGVSGMEARWRKGVWRAYLFLLPGVLGFNEAFSVEMTVDDVRAVGSHQFHEERQERVGQCFSNRLTIVKRHRCLQLLVVSCYLHSSFFVCF